jgi:signal transduction histidine kinase
VSDLRLFARKLWSSRWPEGIWTLFALGNLAWMVLLPSWSMLPYHLTWMSLLLLYGLGVRSWGRVLMWCLVTPVMVATGLVFGDPAIRGRAPYDELIELPIMVVLLLAMARLTNNRKAAMEKLGALSQRNAALLERQREFVQNASHELRTPVTVALAHAELAQRTANPAVSSDVSIVVDELCRMRRLVNELLALATVQSTDVDQHASISLADFVARTMQRWNAIPRRWETSVAEDLIVSADAYRMSVAVDALLENAVRFTNENDRIEVSVRRCGDEAVLTVADSGPGIPADQYDLVFERFRRGSTDAPTSGEPGARENFGLGLSIVRAVAEGFGGRASAAPSQSLGGAAVSVWLPLRDHGVAREPERALALGSAESLRAAPA